MASTLLVTNTGNAGTGSLRQTVLDAAPGDTIRFDPAIDGDTIKLTSGQILLNKNMVITGNGRRKPNVNTDIIKTMNQGTLLINYIGHGNPELWAHEYIFERSVSIPQLNNDKYFFLCAATCDF